MEIRPAWRRAEGYWDQSDSLGCFAAKKIREPVGLSLALGAAMVA